MKKYFSLNYLWRIVRWVWHGKFHLLTITAVIVTIFYITGRLNFYPAIVSALLSITGLFIILTQQMLDASQFADHQPNTVSNWIKSFPTGKPIIATVNGMLGASGTLKARAVASLQPESTIDQKIDFLL